MLSLEPPILEINGTTVFRDHAVADQFYYLAPHPQIARVGGKPMFDLFAYTVELKHSALSGTAIPQELGAGFLTMGVDCVLSEAKRERLRDEIATRTGKRTDEIILLPVPYHKGSVRVIALDKFSKPSEVVESPASEEPLKGRPTFVEAIIGAASPSLFGDMRAIFSLSLSQNGVAFMEGLFLDGAAPVGVVYELSFFGLRPSVAVEIDADLSRIHKHFGGGLQVQYQWVKADISAGLDFLEEKGDINIRITSEQTGEAAQKSKELAMSLFKEQIVQQMFRPLAPAMPNVNAASGLANATGSNTAAAAAGGAAANTSQSSVGLTLKFQRTEELKKVTFKFNERAPEERVHAPQAFLPLLVSKNDFEKRIHRVDLANAFFETLDVLVTGPTKEEFESLRIRQVEATLTYGNPNDPVPPESRSLLFRADSTGDKTFAVKRRGRKTLAYKYSLVYEFTSDPALDADALRLELNGRTSTGRTLLINPTNDFGVLKVEVEPGRIDKTIKNVDVTLAYKSRNGQFTANQNFRLQLDGAAGSTATAPRRWQVRTADRDLAAYTATYAFVFNDGSVYQTPPSEFTEPLLRVDSPFVHQRQLLIKPNVVSQNISQITIEVEYEDAPAKYQRRFFVNLVPPFETKEISWPILDPNRQKIRFRVTTHEPGFISEGEWEETDSTSIVAGAVGSRVAVISVRLIGGSLTEAGLDALMVKLQLADGSTEETDTASLFFEPNTPTTQEARLTLPPGVTLKYRFQTTAFKQSGDVVESVWKESTNKLLVISTRSI